MPPMQRRGNRCAANSRSAESNRLKTGRKQLLSLSLSLSLVALSALRWENPSSCPR